MGRSLPLISSKWLPIQLAPEDCDLEVGEIDKTGIMPGVFHAAENRDFGTTFGLMSRF